MERDFLRNTFKSMRVEIGGNKITTLSKLMAGGFVGGGCVKREKENNFEMKRSTFVPHRKLIA